MFRSMLFALILCAAPATAQDRAPAHPSQSQPAETPTRQVRISAENRALVEDNIRQLLDDAHEALAPGSAALSGYEDVIATLQPAQDYQFPIELDALRLYRFVAVCDADCTDVDIEVLDGVTGEVLASDLLPDDYPIAALRPPASGRYFVRVILKTCTQAPCWVGARVTMGEDTAGRRPAHRLAVAGRAAIGR
ncbi:MAG: hypothetical protein GC206_05240 [Alphaproteobacteria bacterium]|nr:hypothetical protein [Alphaproteobacteria bacterium]